MFGKTYSRNNRSFMTQKMVALKMWNNRLRDELYNYRKELIK